MSSAAGFSMLSSLNRGVKRLFSNRNLFATNLALSFSLSGLGDWLQQLNERTKHPTPSSFKWNVRRTLHMSTSFGLTSGFLCHHWYIFLDRSVVGGTALSVVVRKVLYDQLIFSPVCIAACLVVAGVAEGLRSRAIASDVAVKGGHLFFAECLIWPPAQFVNFYFLPTRYRVAFDNVVSLGFDTYTSHVKHSPTSKEELIFGSEFPDQLGGDIQVCSLEADRNPQMVLRRLPPALYRFGVKMCSSAATDPFFHFYSGSSGEALSKAAFLDSLSAECSTKRGPTVVLLGENHSDPAAHAIELDILKRLHGEVNNLALSLEFYDRESQCVLDEYTAGFVDKETFLKDSRRPGNSADYQPLIDFCAASRSSVVAANCPRRYSRMVSKHGRQALESTLVSNPGASRLLPPMPYKAASDAYREKFVAIMKEMGNNDFERVATKMADAQSLWDATMAHSISEALKSHPLVLHIAGHFHVCHGLGIAEHLSGYAPPETSTVSVVVLPEDDPTKFKEEHTNAADYVILTDCAKLY